MSGQVPATTATLYVSSLYNIKAIMNRSLLQVLFVFLSLIQGELIVKSVYLKSFPQTSISSLSGCTLQTYTVRSKLDCARRCFALTSCISLTYMALGPDMASCVCLLSCSAGNRSFVTSPGTVYINTCGGNTLNMASDSLWLNKTCTYAADCPDKHSTCYNTFSTLVCLCTPGYFYSNSCNTCVPECDERNLLDTFVGYQGGCLWGNDDITLRDVTHEFCQARCAANKRCLTFDYNFVSTTCYLSYQTALTSRSFRVNCSNHYQRMCF